MADIELIALAMLKFRNIETSGIFATLRSDYGEKLRILHLKVENEQLNPNQTVGHRQPEKTGLAGQLPSRW
jgi:hypothetical protein